MIEKVFKNKQTKSLNSIKGKKKIKIRDKFDQISDFSSVPFS